MLHAPTEPPRRAFIAEHGVLGHRPIVDGHAQLNGGKQHPQTHLRTIRRLEGCPTTQGQAQNKKMFGMSLLAKSEVKRPHRQGENSYSHNAPGNKACSNCHSDSHSDDGCCPDGHSTQQEQVCKDPAAIQRVGWQAEVEGHEPEIELHRNEKHALRKDG